MDSPCYARFNLSWWGLIGAGLVGIGFGQTLGQPLAQHRDVSAAPAPLLQETRASQPGTAAVQAEVQTGAVIFRVGDQVVARYVTDPHYAKPFLYPLKAPSGAPVTRGWPVEKGLPGEVTTDHVHQKSVWFCHGDVIPEGIQLKIKTTERGGQGVDFWSEAKDKDGTPRHGRIVCVQVGKPQQIAPGQVRVETINEWLTPDGVKILDEVRVIQCLTQPQGYLFVFNITMKATVCPITFGDTKEGSFGIRVHDALRPSQPTGAIITTAEGKTLAPPAKDNLPIWGHPSAWIDYSGKVGDKAVGVAVFDHPSNPPASWHVRAYGLNAANPFGRQRSGFPSQKGKTELIRIPKGGELPLRYGVYAHDGDAATAKVAQVYDLFRKL